MIKQYVRKWGLLSFVLLLILSIATGCGAQEQPINGEESNSLSNDIENKDDNSIFPVTIIDDANREVVIEKEPESIVSIQASNTEIAFALGLGEKIIGVSDYCNYPEEALDITKVGGQDIKAEVVFSLLPDMAFVTDYHYNTHPDLLKQFEEAGIDVIVVGSATSFKDVYGNIEMIAKATGTQEVAEEIITDMKERHQAIKDKAKAITDQKKVWVEVAPAPDIFTTGTNTFMHEMLESIHAINVAQDHEGWVKLNEEEIVQLNPDVIITTYGYYIDNPKEQVLSREGWAEVPAVKNELVFDVDSDTVTRPGPRLIEGVETLAEFIYPEVFSQ
ncbi:iron ABC transporter substrate-binding protein [Ureibacillus massiliensis 4400831 = CIP 108448 = CCUG 49529]|uniref:Iron ABC transporter substrate-binding protein n=1 Tax=Ureibacillus massiliensis 4400831 = CIP 108448 = CCUG 49529 TaxID=1211035 RepID=A0A0A3JAX6_9BACL|nr:ABC transporter substrate-binding protein [Ureibacillus massiliensis]KGR92303.1 iron ABC transporter substrate-binding protein [Ureibacillus massiliensis 4400831 = CIP 108448 = CCUG 49529]